MGDSASALKSCNFCSTRTIERLDFFEGDDKIFATAVVVKHGDKDGRNWSVERQSERRLAMGRTDFSTIIPSLAPETEDVALESPVVTVASLQAP